MKNMTNWMAYVQQSTPVFNVSIPGTHESCALHDDGTLNYTRCQSQSIPEQLNSGIRFLDIRPTYEYEGIEFEITHGGHDQQITFAKVQEQVVEFLKANPSEVVLMNIQQEESLENNANFVARFDSIVAGFEDYWWFDERIPTIEEARGRIVLVRGYDPLTFNPTKPVDGSWLTDKGIPLNALTSEGSSSNKYFRTQNYSKALEREKIMEIEKLLAEGIVDNRIALNFLSYAHFGATPWANAEVMNPRINEHIKQQRFAQSPVGLLAMDFVGNTPGFVDEITRHNLPWNDAVAADFSNTGVTEVAVFRDCGKARSQILLFPPLNSGTIQPRVVWDSGDGGFDAGTITKVVAGKFSGSGKAEIAVFCRYVNNRTKLWLFTPDGDESQQRRMAWDSGEGHWSADHMMHVQAGDFSGKGKTEITAFYRYGNARTCLWLFAVAANGSVDPRRVWDSGDGKWDANHMTNAAIGDFSGKGKTEIAVFYRYSNARTCLWLFNVPATGTAAPLKSWDSGDGNWEARNTRNMVAGNFSAPGKTEIAAFYTYGETHTGLWQFSFAADGSASPQKLWDSGQGNWAVSQMSKTVTGDFSGAGTTEIGVFYEYEGKQTAMWLFKTGAWKPQQVWDSGKNNWKAGDMGGVLTGHFSTPGKFEIAAFYDYNLAVTGLWKFSATGGAAFIPQMMWKGNYS